MQLPTSTPFVHSPQWWVRWAIWSVLVALMAGLFTALFTAPGWWKAPLHIRTHVPEAAAREVLFATVGHTLVHGTADLCATLGTHPASSCVTSMQRAGKPPGRAPGIRCVTSIDDGPFAGATVLTVRGRDDVGELYTTDFVVIDDGHGPQALDPVYWSRLHLVETAGEGPSSGIKTTTWRYDGESTRCQ